MAKRGSNIYKRKDGRFEGRVPVGYQENGKLSTNPYMQERFPKLRKRCRIFIQSGRISLFLQ